MRKLALVLIVLVAVALGCSEGDDLPDAENPSPDAGAETESEDPSNDPGSSGVLLTFRRSGGLAGATETITIRADGRGEIEGDATPPQRLDVPPELLSQLEEELRTLDWARAGTEPENVDCADCFLYDIRSGGQRVTTTGMGQSGEELRDLLALVDEIIALGSTD
ncbi:MAG TPA: hypothetical protein VFD47_12090 [Actinomycetota bacterium]|nr:hypothetical protein [Actinomycetota bacterium]